MWKYSSINFLSSELKNHAVLTFLKISFCSASVGRDLANPLPKHVFANVDVNNNDNSFFACQDFFLSLAPDFQFASDATVL